MAPKLVTVLIMLAAITTSVMARPLINNVSGSSSDQVLRRALNDAPVPAPGPSIGVTPSPEIAPQPSDDAPEPSVSAPDVAPQPSVSNPEIAPEPSISPLASETSGFASEPSISPIAFQTSGVASEPSMAPLASETYEIAPQPVTMDPTVAPGPGTVIITSAGPAAAPESTLPPVSTVTNGTVTNVTAPVPGGPATQLNTSAPVNMTSPDASPTPMLVQPMPLEEYAATTWCGTLECLQTAMVNAQSVNNSIIYVTDNIDLKGQPLPSVTNYLEVMGNCPDGCCWIDAHLLSQVFIVTANGHFTSHDLDVRNGKAAGCGGAVWVAAGGKAGFFMTKFNNSTASTGGAVCFDKNSSGYFKGGSFLGNLASATGGDVFIDSGACVSFTETNFRGSSADKGGAVYANTGGSADVTVSLFDRNSAKTAGGAIAAATGSTVSVELTQFTGNTAPTGPDAALDAGATNSFIQNTFVTGSGTVVNGNVCSAPSANCKVLTPLCSWIPNDCNMPLTPFPLPQPSPSPASSPVPSPSPMASPQPSNSPVSPSPSPRASASPSPIPQPSASPSPRASPNPSPSASPLPSAIPSPSSSVKASPLPSPSASALPSPIPSPSASPKASPSASPRVSPVPSPSASAHPSPVASPSASPSASPLPSSVASPSPIPSPSASPLPSPIPSPSASPLPSPVASRSPVPSPLASPSASAHPSPIPSPSASAHPSPIPSPSASPLPSPVASPSPIPSPSASPLPSPIPSPSASPLPSPSPSILPPSSPKPAVTPPQVVIQEAPPSPVAPAPTTRKTPPPAPTTAAPAPTEKTKPHTPSPTFNIQSIPTSVPPPPTQTEVPCDTPLASPSLIFTATPIPSPSPMPSPSPFQKPVPTTNPGGIPQGGPVDEPSPVSTSTPVTTFTPTSTPVTTLVNPEHLIPCETPPVVPPPCSESGNGTSVKGDPHLVGKHGERFDFMGVPGKDYCLIADKNVHVNMHVFEGRREGTTYISEMGLLIGSDEIYVSAHSAQTVGWKDFQGMVLVNGVELPLSEVNLTLENGLSVSRTKTSVRVVKAPVLDVTLDIARASFWENGPGKNFINFKVTSLAVSPSVHGVLGQTYREDERTYKKLANASEHTKLRSNGMPFFVDGEDADYQTSGVMTADCNFARFKPQGLSLSSGARKMLSAEDATAILISGSRVGDF